MLKSNENILDCSVKTNNSISAQVLDEENKEYVRNLYTNTTLHIISEEQFLQAFYTEDKDIYSKIKFKVVFSADYDSLKPHLMLGYINNDGTFFQSIQKFDTNKPIIVYVQGRFNNNDMKNLQTIYNKAYEHKLNNYN